MFLLWGCSMKQQVLDDATSLENIKAFPHLVVLGVAQDAGYPQANCKKSCCAKLWEDPSQRKMVSCLGFRDPIKKNAYLFDATPDIRFQLNTLLSFKGIEYDLEGIFVTHAHIGHYTGLMHLGREAMGAESVSTYVMPRMASYISDNGPWSNLVNFNHIRLHAIADRTDIKLETDLIVRPLLVPHRDEYSETVGFLIDGPTKKALFIPDIDKWHKWDTDINALIEKVDYAFLDGTFYRNGEIWGRDMSQIPHPFIEESVGRFKTLSSENKSKIYFIHFNHTNPLLNEGSEEFRSFKESNFNLAKEGQVFPM